MTEADKGMPLMKPTFFDDNDPNNPKYKTLNKGGVIPPDKPKIFFISLCRGLVGYYVKAIAYDEETVRRHAAEYFGRMWCSVYSEAYLYEILRKRYPDNTKIVNNNYPIDLTNGWEWE